MSSVVFTALTVMFVSALLVGTVLLTRLRERLAVALREREHLSSLVDGERAEVARLAAELSHEKSLRIEAGGRLASSEARLASALEQLEQMRRQRADDEARFRQLSAETLQMQSGQWSRQTEGRLAELLGPLRDDLARFRTSVGECYSNEARERFALKESIAALIAQTQTIGAEATALASALRGNSKTQGDWGEMILESLLEKSGLREGEEFVVQQTRDASGNIMRTSSGGLLRPDVVVYFPGERAVVIDSKVSLTAFADWVNGDEASAEGREARKQAGHRHVESVRKHISELAAKSYQDHVGGRALDFVLMFIPNEGAYMAAMSIEPGLWQEAYDKRVLIVSPTHLVSVLRLTSQLWVQERQRANAVKIAVDAGRMYDKLVGFVDDMRRLERAIGQASSAWADAMRKLSTGTGNLIGRAEQLRQMGAKASKRLPADLVLPADPDPDAVEALPEPEDEAHSERR